MNQLDGRATQSISLWHDISPAGHARPALQGTLDADLVVIGGGFAGLSTALHSAEKGLSVVVLEAEILAWGATGRNAGFVVPNFAKRDPDDIIAELGPERGENLVNFAASGADLVFRLIQQHDIHCDAVQNGWIQPAHSPAAMDKTASRAEQWARRGRPVATLDAKEILALTGIRGYLGGWMDRSGGLLNPVAFARGLADAATKAGARIFEQSRVTAINRIGDGWSIQTASGSVRAGKVLLATNAYGGSLRAPLRRSYFPVKIFQIATAPLPDKVRDRLLPGGQGVGDTRRNLFTCRFDSQNRLISGGMHILGPGADSRVPHGIWRRLAQHLDLPDLPPLAHSWTGVAAVEPDFLPRLVDLGPGLIAGFACNGRGIAMTTAMGKVLADWACGSDAEDLPLPFAPPAPIPFHSLMRHAPNAMLIWSTLRDRLEKQS